MGMSVSLTLCTSLSNSFLFASLLLLAFCSKGPSSGSSRVIRSLHSNRYEMHFAIVITPVIAIIGYSFNLIFYTIRLPLFPGIRKPSHMLLSSEGYMFKLSLRRHPNISLNIHPTVTRWICGTKFQNNWLLGSV